MVHSRQNIAGRVDPGRPTRADVPGRIEDINLELGGGGALGVVGEDSVRAGQLACGTQDAHHASLNRYPAAAGDRFAGAIEPKVLEVGGIAGGGNVEEVGLAFRELDR